MWLTFLYYIEQKNGPIFAFAIFVLYAIAYLDARCIKVRCVDQSEFDIILSMVGRKAMINYRNYCILVMMISYGMKTVDFINLKVDDIDWNAGIMSLRRKERVYRKVKLSEEDLSMLRGLLALYQGFGGSIWLFRSYDGNKLTNHIMIKMMKTISRKTGVQLTTKDINATYIARRVESEVVEEVARDLGYCSGKYLNRFFELE